MSGERGQWRGDCSIQQHGPQAFKAEAGRTGRSPPQPMAVNGQSMQSLLLLQSFQQHLCMVCSPRHLSAWDSPPLGVVPAAAMSDLQTSGSCERTHAYD
jgi:hypothetical protein